MKPFYLIGIAAFAMIMLIGAGPDGKGKGGGGKGGPGGGAQVEPAVVPEYLFDIVHGTAAPISPCLLTFPWHPSPPRA